MIDIKQVEIAAYKREARAHYLRFTSLTSKYDCGLALATYINPDAEKARVAFNTTMDRLAELDPSAPKERL